jgi:hypothetical protein
LGTPTPSLNVIRVSDTVLNKEDGKSVYRSHLVLRCRHRRQARYERLPVPSVMFSFSKFLPTFCHKPVKVGGKVRGKARREFGADGLWIYMAASSARAGDGRQRSVMDGKSRFPSIQRTITYEEPLTYCDLHSTLLPQSRLLEDSIQWVPRLIALTIQLVP